MMNYTQAMEKALAVVGGYANTTSAEADRRTKAAKAIVIDWHEDGKVELTERQLDRLQPLE